MPLKDKTEPKKEAYTTVIADRDNLNRESYQNLTWISSTETIVQQSETVTSDVLTFTVPKCPPGDYYDLSSMRMQTELLLLDKDGVPPVQNSVVGPINYFCQTMIKSVEVLVNGTQVITAAPYYAQKAYVDALINHSHEDRQGILTNQGFAMDKPKNLTVEPSFLTHVGFRNRTTFFAEYDENGKVMNFHKNGTTFEIPLLTDLNKIDVPLLSKVELKIVITFNSPKYYLWTAADEKDKGYYFKVTKSVMRIKQLRATDGYTRSLEDEIEKKPLKYRFKRIEPILDTLSSGSANFSRSFSMTTNLPERIIVLMQKEELLNPGYEDNPLNWNGGFEGADAAHKAELVECELTINGNSTSKLRGHDFYSFTSLHYQELMEQTGNDRFGCGLIRKYFGSGSYMIPFDLTKSGRSGTSGSIRQPVKEGQAVLSIKFKNGPKKSIAILILQEFNASFTVDKNRKVLFNYID